MIYSEAIKTRLTRLAHCRELSHPNALGTGVNLACGSMVRFFLLIEKDGLVTDAAFRSNGCGHSRAAADVLAEWVTDRRLVELNGLANAKLIDVIQDELREISSRNSACTGASIDAMRSAFADYRTRQVREFCGEEALICTCFAVTEERIEDLIAKSRLTSVEQVTNLSGAGGGCGSCRMLIQELLDSVL